MSPTKTFIAVILVILISVSFYTSEKEKYIKSLKEELYNNSIKVLELEETIELRDLEITETKREYENEIMLREELEKDMRILQEEKEQLQRELDSITTVRAVATSYTAFCNTGCIGITATGHNVKNTTHYKGKRVVAVDPDVIPLGSVMKVEAEDREFIGIALDTGGDIKGNRIDVLVSTIEKANNFGVQNATVHILGEENY